MTRKKQRGTAPKASRATEAEIAGAFDPTLTPPPADWLAHHRGPRGRIILGVVTWNPGAIPVPRQASCHFYAPSHTRHDYYGY
jgi:hypothetical protein